MNEKSTEAEYLKGVENSSGIAHEHALNTKTALKEQWKAVMWSVIISCSIIMYGYDNALIGNFYAYPSFAKKYGNYYPSVGKYELSAPWQAALPNGATVGVFFGALANGYISSWWGYKKVLIGGLIFMNAAVFINFFAPSVQVLMVGEVMSGLPWGIFATTGPSYSSELCPTVLRGYLTSAINLYFVVGQIVVAGVLESFSRNTTQWSYRIPFALQWMWPTPIFLCVLFAPESPWWLLRKGRIEDAEKVIRRISSMDDETIESHISMMIRTTELEIQQQNEGSFLQCFKGTNLRRTEVAGLVFVAQAMTGINMVGSYFYEQVGLSPYQSFQVLVGNYGLALIGSIAGSIAVANFGRRMVFNTGIYLVTILLFIIGCLSIARDNEKARWAQVGLALVWSFVWQSTIGIGAYVISSEISAINLRVYTVAIAKNIHNISNVIASVLEPYMINPAAWDWAGYTAFFWCGCSLILSVWAYFRIPETRGKTYQELDILFDNRIPSRQFNKVAINLSSGMVESRPSATLNLENH